MTISKLTRNSKKDFLGGGSGFLIPIGLGPIQKPGRPEFIDLKITKKWTNFFRRDGQD